MRSEKCLACALFWTKKWVVLEWSLEFRKWRIGLRIRIGDCHWLVKRHSFTKDLRMTQCGHNHRHLTHGLFFHWLFLLWGYQVSPYRDLSQIHGVSRAFLKIVEQMVQNWSLWFCFSLYFCILLYLNNTLSHKTGCVTSRNGLKIMIYDGWI